MEEAGLYDAEPRDLARKSLDLSVVWYLYPALILGAFPLDRVFRSSFLEKRSWDKLSRLFPYLAGPKVFRSKNESRELQAYSSSPLPMCCFCEGLVSFYSRGSGSLCCVSHLQSLPYYPSTAVPGHLHFPILNSFASGSYPPHPFSTA